MSESSAAERSLIGAQPASGNGEPDHVASEVPIGLPTDAEESPSRGALGAQAVNEYPDPGPDEELIADENETDGVEDDGGGGEEVDDEELEDDD